MKLGDVVMAVSGAVGLPAILNIDACIHDGFVGFRSLSTNIYSEYLYCYLSLMREVSKSQAVGATFQNLNTEQIRNWMVPIAPQPAQAALTERLADLRSIIAQQERSLAAARELERSLMARLLG